MPCRLVGWQCALGSDFLINSHDGQPQTVWHTHRNGCTNVGRARRTPGCCRREFSWLCCCLGSRPTPNWHVVLFLIGLLATATACFWEVGLHMCLTRAADQITIWQALSRLHMLCVPTLPCTHNSPHPHVFVAWAQPPPIRVLTVVTCNMISYPYSKPCTGSQVTSH